MKRVKRSHGTSCYANLTIKFLRKFVYKQATNNYKRMHGKPMERREALRKVAQNNVLLEEIRNEMN